MGAFRRRSTVAWVVSLGLTPLPGAFSGPHAPGAGRPSAVARPQSTLARDVDAYFEPIVRSHEFAGAVLIARGDRVLFEKGYGMANAELDVPNSPTTIFRIASITKTFTAAAIAMLAERGALRYSDSLSKYLPDFPN